MSGTVLVTGGGGFVGSAVVRRLVRWVNEGSPTFWDGAPVTEVCAVLRPASSDSRLQELGGLSRWRIERLDLGTGELPALLAQQKPKAVLHLAFDAAGFGPQSEQAWRRMHLEPLQAIFQGLSPTGSRVVHTSSAWVLAQGDQLSETAMVAPRLEYARAKARLDEALPRLGESTGVRWINLRLFNVFGRYEHKSRLLPHLVASLRSGTTARLSHGDQVRDFNDVDDVAEAYLRALIAPDDVCNSLYHVGSGIGTRVRDFGSMLCSETGRDGRVEFSATQTRDQEITCLVANPARIIAKLGWRPVSDLRERIRRSVQWWLSRPDDELAAIP